MTPKEQKLHYIDLCSRLPYLPCVKVMNKKDNSHYMVLDLNPILIQDMIEGRYDLRLYLRSMSTMTDEEWKELSFKALVDNEGTPGDIEAYIDYLNSHHFDWRGLIKQNLAEEAEGEILELYLNL